MRWALLESAEEVAGHACTLILDAAERAIHSRSLFSIVLAGGSTPELTYAMLARRNSSWDRWAVYFRDERGLGSDGHVASLFPGHCYQNDSLVVPVRNSPKTSSKRISMSPVALGNSREMISIVTGSEKQDAVLRWHNGEPLPVSTIESKGSWDVLLDREAWSDGVGNV